MKPSSEWRFSAQVKHIDINRILREVEETGASVARITIDGKVYTAFRSRHPFSWAIDNPCHVTRDSIVRRNFDMPAEAESTNAVDGEDDIMVLGERKPCRWLIKAGDHLGTLLDRVVTHVEVFK